MPTTIDAELVSWGRDLDPGTIRQAERTARLAVEVLHTLRQVPNHKGT